MHSLNGKCDVEFDRLDNADWDEVIQQFDDANLWQSSTYGHVAFGSEHLEQVILRKNGSPVAAAQVAVVSIPFIPTQIAYVKYGPLWRPKNTKPDPENFRTMLSCLIDTYAIDQGKLLRLLPRVSGQVLGSMDDLVHGAAVHWRSRPAGGTYLLDLSPDLETLRSQMRPRWRSKLNQSERGNLQVTEVASQAGFEKFLAQYRAMLARKGFADYSEFFRIPALQTELPGQLKLKLFACFDGDDMAATSLCWTIGDTAIVLFGTTSETGRRLGASYVLDWWLVQHLKKQGYAWMDLGGAGALSVNKYKRGLTGRDTSEVTFAGKFDFHLNPVVLSAFSFTETVRAKVHDFKARWKSK